MMKKLIYGIQQIGVGVTDAPEAFSWYAKNLGADVLVFEDENDAVDMAPYMGGEPHAKHAMLSINMQGGSGYEIWQYKDRQPKFPEFDPEPGDLGIFCGMIKSRDLNRSFDRMSDDNIEIIRAISQEPDGHRSFSIKDPYGNRYRIKEYNCWYSKNSFDLGGLFGAQIGVSDIDQSLKLYKDILGYNEIVYDETGCFDDLVHDNFKIKPEFRRVLLAHRDLRRGGFSPLFGRSRIELIQRKKYTPRKIFEDRFWGDVGFIHLCFDIRHMKALTEECSENGFSFKVLSDESFGMGDTNGHFGYIEDPDGTLIEFVETHRVPLIRKLKWNINLRNRDPHKPLPNWMIKALALKRVKV